MKKIQYVVHRIITPVKLFADNLTTANTDGPAEMNILIEPFFSSKWVSKKRWKWRRYEVTWSKFLFDY